MAYVLISTDKNSQLHDQSNREGLIEGLALDAPGVFDPCIRTFVKLASGASRLYAEIVVRHACCGSVPMKTLTS